MRTTALRLLCTATCLAGLAQAGQTQPTQTAPARSQPSEDGWGATVGSQSQTAPAADAQADCPAHDSLNDARTFARCWRFDSERDDLQHEVDESRGGLTLKLPPANPDLFVQPAFAVRRVEGDFTIEAELDLRTLAGGPNQAESFVGLAMHHPESPERWYGIMLSRGPEGNVHVAMAQQEIEGLMMSGKTRSATDRRRVRLYRKGDTAGVEYGYTGGGELEWVRIAEVPLTAWTAEVDLGLVFGTFDVDNAAELTVHEIRLDD